MPANRTSTTLAQCEQRVPVGLAAGRRTAAKDVALRAWKFEAPRLSERLLPREHLLDKLEQQLGRKQATGDVFLIAAPAGYGKTSLIAQWAQRARMPVVWYHLDASDSDPAVFIRGLVRALRAACPRAQWEVEQLLTRARSGALSPLDVRRALAVLISNIQRNITRPAALILTSISELPSSSGAHAVLDGLLARQPDHLRLVLEARELPRLRLSPLLTQRRVEGLGVDDLRLRDDEYEQLLALLGLQLTPEEAERLRTLSAGWLTGILLATGALLPSFLPVCTGPEFDHERVFDYLAAEVIETLPPSLGEFATEAAVLSYMTAPLCANLLELTDARERLLSIEKRTGFVTRVGRRPEEPVYRFQPLLRQALLERLEQRPDGPAQRRALHERAGQLLETMGDYDEAVVQYAQAGAFERVVAAIEARRGALLRAGHGATLARWLDLLPEHVRESQPELQILLAELHWQAGRIADAERAIEQACATLLPRAQSARALAARALVVRAAVAYPRGQFTAVQRDCAEALRLAPADQTEVQVRAQFLRAYATQALDGPAAASHHLDDLEKLCAAQRDLWALAKLHYLRSRLLIAQGAYSQAESSASAALMHAQEANDEVTAISARLNLGLILSRTNRLQLAREHFELAQTHAEASGYALGTAYALANLGDLEVILGQFAQAASSYETAATAARAAGDLHLQLCSAANQGYALTVMGESAAAVELLAPVLDFARTRGSDTDRATVATVLGFAQMRQGAIEPAVALLEEAASWAQRGEATVELAHAQLHLAAALLARGQRAPATSALSAACAAVQHADGVSLLLTETRQLPEVQVLLAQVSHPLATELLARLRAPKAADGAGSEPGAAAVTAGDPASRAVRVFALGEARVYVGTERVTRWRKPLARELLYFLLDQREPVQKDVVLEALWPDRDPEQSEADFRQARFWLKQALGMECIAQQDGRWHLTIDCWLDVREFERLAEEGARLYQERRITDAAAMLSQALTYWTGDYLTDAYRDWAIARRDALRRRYLTTLELLANVESLLGRYDEAAQRYYQILEAEPHRETAHRALMRYFERRGEPAEALRQFARCCNLLRQELGILPSRETLSLYRAIRARLDPAHTPTTR
jgi:LuxR family maltose regulon positive regulatory protein